MTASTETVPGTAAPAEAAPRRSRAASAAGWTLSGLTGAFLLFDGVIHVLNVGPVQETMTSLGYPTDAAPLIGVVELVCLALYLVPRTTALGAVLLTGYLGGAVATQLRVEAPFLSTVLFPVYLGAVLWAGAWLRDRRTRAIVR